MAESMQIFDYPRDQLVGNEEVGGELAFGFGCVLIDVRVFREIPQPWFNAIGCGEDWFFCTRCAEYKIPRYVDTRVKVQHRMHTAVWATEDKYWEDRKAQAAQYKEIYGI